jgi:hypothetical protein
MKKLSVIFLAVLLSISMAGAGHAFDEDVYGTWNAHGLFDASVCYMWGGVYDFYAHMSIDFQVGRIPWDQVKNYNTEDTTYRPLNTAEAIEESLNEAFSGGTPDGTINYIYLPEEYLGEENYFSYHEENVDLPGFGNSEVSAWNNNNSAGFSVFVDRQLYDGAQDIYHASINKQPDIFGVYEFNIAYFRGAQSWSDSILYTSMLGSGELHKTSSFYLAPVTKPEPEISTPPAPTPPVYTNPSPRLNPPRYDDGR